MRGLLRTRSVCAALLLAASAHAQTAAPHTLSPRERSDAAKAYAAGAKAIEHHDMRAAYGDFTTALKLDPENKNYQLSVEITRQDLVTQLVEEANKAKLLDHRDQWRARLAEAAALDPKNAMVQQHVDELAHESISSPATLRPQRDDAGGLIELAPLPGKHSYHLTAQADLILHQVFLDYGIGVSIDKSVKTERVRFDADDVTFPEAMQELALVTNTFFVPLDPKRVLAALDTKENRILYERLALETVYLPGLSATEMTDVGNIARNLFDVKEATVSEATGTMTVRAPQTKLAALNTVLSELLEGRSEVLLDVNFYEISRTRNVTEGVELPSSSNIFNVSSEVESLIAANPSLVQEIIASGLANPGNLEEIAAAIVLSGMGGSSLLSQPFAIFGGGLTTSGLTLAASSANLTLDLADTRALDQVQLRLLDQEEGTVRVGERYPIITSSYSNLATGASSIAGINTAGLSSTLASLGISAAQLQSAATATVPQVQYQDLGLSLHATSRVEQTREVSMKVEFKLTSLEGDTLNGNPVLNSREYSSLITLKPGEKAVLVSSLTNQETAALTGIPFLSEIPGLPLPTNRSTMKMQSSLVIIITPHVVRMTHTNATGKMILLPQHS
jgi:general secretion pathway protein D